MEGAGGGPERRGAFMERVRRLRRSRADEAEAEASPADRIERLERRIEHLESALEGLQDSVHRESTRHSEQIAELRHRTDPHEMAQALGKDARRRGV
jgi:vacuolar-type H+-ATPase subunit I/STV1